MPFAVLEDSFRPGALLVAVIDFPENVVTTSETGQNRLKNKLTEITSLLPTGAPVAYLDYPVHGNFGDLLIFLGTLSFLHDHNYKIETCKSLHWLPEKISPDAVVLLHGGGNLGDLYPPHQKFREAAIARFSNNRIVVLPQTIHYQQTIGFQHTRKILGSHPDLHLILRDAQSLEIAKQEFPKCKLRLIPDMAHHLWPGPSNGAISTRNNGQPVFLIRNDKERAAIFPELDRHAAQFRDWADFFTAPEARQIRLGKFLHRVNGKLHGKLPLARPWRWVCNKLYMRLSQEFSGQGPIITSRLHGTIFGTLLGKKTGLLDNSYGKNRRYYDTWANDLDGVAFIDSPDTLGNFLK